MAAKMSKKPRENLTEKVIARIRLQIDSGQLTVGDKLPTEPKLIEQMGVSRTVIREAIASLKADGLLEPKHGVGVFVRALKKQQSELSLWTQHSQKISDVVESLELRLAVEAESAALAAARCSPAQEAELCEKYYAFERRLKLGENTEKADFEFHLAIAKATNNQYFVEFLTLAGRKTIPRARLREEAGLVRDPVLEGRLNNEHKGILEAIVDRDPERAREAMRSHLKDGSNRYRALAREAQEKQLLEG
ncbi:MAG: FadR/GntR family transcriptional regulator [Oceanospirillaceae bacterium]